MFEKRKTGWIECICGSMFSGKSEELIRRIKRGLIAKQKILLFKPKIDDRYNVDKISTHNGNTFDSVAISSSEEIYSYIENKKYDNIAEALDKWREYVMSFGFGKPLGSDFPAELGGTIPSSKYYNRVYGKGGWKFTTIVSLSIGQGEIGVTPLQIANLCATVANRGYYYIPHIIKESEGVKLDPKFKKRNYTMVDTTHFNKGYVAGCKQWLRFRRNCKYCSCARIGYMWKNRYGTKSKRSRQFGVHLFCTKG